MSWFASKILNLEVVYTITTSADNGTLNAVGYTPWTAGRPLPANMYAISYNSSQLFTVIPTNGYHLTSLIDNGNDVTSQVTSGSYTISGITSNHTLAAAFGINTYVTYTINADVVGNGAITHDGLSGVATVNEGSTPTFVFVPAPGYHVDNVTVDGSVVSFSGNQYIFPAVTANHTISVTFAINTYTITVIAGAHGAIVPSGTAGVVTVNYQATPGFTITADGGYHIASLTIDSVAISLSGNTYTFTPVNANHVLAAAFEANNITISVSPDNQTVPLGSTFTVDIMINTNTAIRGWQLNINFDPSKLQANSVTEGTFLKNWAQAQGDSTQAGSNGVINNLTGTFQQYKLCNHRNQ